LFRGRAGSCGNDVRPALGLVLGCAVVAICAVFALSIAAAPALAAPEWGIEMTHANAYGLQASECPTHKEESFPGEPEKDCGVDPFTGSGTTFGRESGSNIYSITVTNTAGPPSIETVAGETLPCEPGTWEDGPTFSYHWLRNGIAIPGAEGPEYTVTAADEGKALQCSVTGTNDGSASRLTSLALAVSPVPSSALPAPETQPAVSGEGSSAQTVGTTLTCSPGDWTESPTFSYQWLRNGTAILDASASSYTLTTADEGTNIQCQVTATTGGGGAVSADNRYPVVVEPEPNPYPPYVEIGNPPPTITEPTNAVAGPVSVADHLPNGLVLQGETEEAQAHGVGWTCKVENATTVTCMREPGDETLGPGASYPPIKLNVGVTNEAPLGFPPAGGVTNLTTVYGGGARLSASVSDPTTVTPAVPFGIQSFSTSVTDSLGAPLTQAGGHPFAANAVFVLNTTVTAVDSLVGAGGSAKDIETELPPGFIGDPQNAPRCTEAQFEFGECPRDSAIGFVDPQINSSSQATLAGGRSYPFAGGENDTVFVYNVAPSPGIAAQFGFEVSSQPFAINARLRSDGDYGITIGDEASARGSGSNSRGVWALNLTFCAYGVSGEQSETVGVPPTAACATPTVGSKPFLTSPTRCTGAAPTATLTADTYENQAAYVSKTVYNGTKLTGSAPSASESFVTACNLLQFNPEVEFKPSPGPEGGTTQADEPTGASFALKVPLTNEAGVNATPELKDAAVTLPEGMTVDPSAADGLQACSNAQFGLGSKIEPAEPASCPLASQVGTVKVTTPLLEKPLEGQVFVGEPECSPCNASDAEAGRIFRLFLQIRSPERGVIVKLAGHVSANPTTGRLQATFTEQPQLPFSELLLTFTGGARAALANPQTCGTFTTTTDLTPWSTSGLGGPSGSEPIAGTPDATPSSSFDVDWDGAGGACPAMPFSPSFSAGSQTPAAGASSPFSVTLGREDREQDISAVTVTTPPGLLGKITGVEECPEAQANAGTCGAASEIGSTTVGAGPGSQPFYLGGRVYLTGPYRSAPFGLSIVVPAVAGPFNLGTVVVRAAITVNPSTAALTITADPLPQFVDGVQLRLHKINIEVNRPGFMLNPTSCLGQGVGATIGGAEGASASVSTPFEVGGCSSLPFAPKLTTSTQGKTSKAGGASLTVSVASAAGEANIAKVDLQLPKTLPSRLTTLQKACTEAQFDANPAGCPAASDIGTAKALTPILAAPLSGPAYIVSHGGASFPDVELVLQGEGVTIILDGKTDIKGGLTYSRFEAVPDAPISHFEAILPEGPHSILTTDIPASAKSSLCGRSLTIPTIITAQNGKQLKQNTKVTVTGCKATKPLTRAQQLARARKQCKRHKHRKVRAGCERQARKRYGPRKATKAKTPGTKPTNGSGGKRS
jgi:hypothetical protein